MPATNYMSTITLPVDISGTITDVEFTIKDAEAADRLTTIESQISSIGSAVIWIGATTTPITDGDNTNPITINGQLVTAVGGNMTAYNGEEFVWDTENAIWQTFGIATHGALAYKDNASGSYTPAGSITITKGTDTTAVVTSLASVGTLPNAFFTVENNNATFHFNAGTLPSSDSGTSVVIARGTDTATFTGTAATITVS